MVDRPSATSQEERDFWGPDPRDRRSIAGTRGDRATASWSYTARDRLLDRIRDWRSDARLGVVALVLVALVAGTIWYRVGIGGASADEPASSASPAGGAQAPSSASSSASDARRETGAVPAAPVASSTPKGQQAKLFVHVAGAVVHPGVVELAGGARVIDAIEAVGGALTEGDLDRLNLAAKVVDGQRVYVARAGEADPGVVGGDAGAAGADPSGTGVVEGKVNLNTATQAQLEQLPGIGPTYAQAIIAERQRRGGFKSVNELRSVHGIGEKRFAELVPLVAV